MFLGVNDGCFIFLCINICIVTLNWVIWWIGKLLAAWGFPLLQFFIFLGASAKGTCFMSLCLHHTHRRHIDLNVSSLLYWVCSLFLLMQFNSFHVCVTVSHQSSWTLIKRNFFLHCSRKNQPIDEVNDLSRFSRCGTIVRCCNKNNNWGGGVIFLKTYGYMF